MPAIAYDGPFRSATPVQIGQAEIEYPFAALGDTTTYVRRRTFKQHVDFFSPATLGTVDPLDANAYLIAESPPLPTATGLVRFERTYAKIPGELTDYSTLVLTLPVLEDLGGISLTGYLLRERPNGIFPLTATQRESTLYSDRGQLYGDAKAASTNTHYLTGGTFTLKYKTSTTAAIDYDEDDANIISALNNLSDVISDGITFDLANNQLDEPTQASLTLGATTSFSVDVTIDLTSATPSTARTSYTYRTSTGSQVLGIATRLTITGHGFDESDTFAIVNENTSETFRVWVFDPDIWEEIDANTVAVYFPFNYSDELLAFAEESSSYTPGTVRVPCRLVSNFYLPGVSPGITTAADIPVPARVGTEAIVNALLAGSTGTMIVDVNDFVRWLGGPIIQLTTVEIDLEQL